MEEDTRESSSLVASKSAAKYLQTRRRCFLTGACIETRTETPTQSDDQTKLEEEQNSRTREGQRPIHKHDQ